MRILILEHQPDAPAALVGEWARARGHELVVVRVPELTCRPDPRDFDAIVSLGSHRSVHASPPSWLGAELETLTHAHEHDIPVLGICFGGQALARVLGGAVDRAPQVQVRWRELDSRAPELVTDGPWFWWHGDRFSLPPGAELLAGSANQAEAFAAGRSVGLQFHPEVDGALVRDWLAGGRARLSSQGVDTERLDGEVADHGDGARARAFDQFDRIAAWWARA